MEHFSGPRGEIDAFSNGENTQAHCINLAMSTTPQTLKNISAQCELTDLARIRIRRHMDWLVERGFAWQHDQSWALTESAAIKFNEEPAGSGMQ